MLKVAILGAGIGEKHAAGYAKLPDRFKIHTICDLDADRGQPVARQYGAAFCADIDTVLANSDIDIVDVCLPPHLHFDICLKAMDAGKSVICEKPLVSSLAETDQLVVHAKASKQRIFPVFQYRYGLGSAQLLALMRAGLAGTCYAGTLETHWDRGADYYALPWRGTWSGEQGGAMLGHAIHIHDLLTGFLGPVRNVFARTATRVNSIEVEDCAALSIEMANGALITSSVTLGAAGNTSRLRLMFEGFTVESDQAPYEPATAAWNFVARAPTRQTDIDAVLSELPPPLTGFAGLFEAVADALEGNTGAEVTLEDARRSLEFVTAAYASQRSKQSVALPIDKTHPLYAGWVP